MSSRRGSRRSSSRFACKPKPRRCRTSRASRRPRSKSTDSMTPSTADFGTQCLLARRLSERGVRFVQCNLGGWDAHNNLKANHNELARAIDKPIAGLLTDLRQRGPLGRYPRGLGWRVRPHPDLRGDRRPRSQSPRLHDVAGRRRREGRDSPGARPTTTDTTRSMTKSTCTTFTPRSSTCWAWTTSG